MTAEEIEQDRIASEKKAAMRLVEKGHDCWDNDNIVHGFDSDSRLGDYYTCRKCGDLLQVG